MARLWAAFRDRWDDPGIVKRHLRLYAAVCAGALLLSLSGEWFGPIVVGWAALLMVHYLVVKTFNVDEGWADKRSAELRMRSYDHKHVSQIVESATEGDPGTDPAAPRNGRPPRPGSGEAEPVPGTPSPGG